MKQRGAEAQQFVFHALSVSLSLSLAFHSAFLSKTRFPGKRRAFFFLFFFLFLCGKSDLCPVSQNQKKKKKTLDCHPFCAAQGNFTTHKLGEAKTLDYRMLMGSTYYSALLHLLNSHLFHPAVQQMCDRHSPRI